MFESIRNWYTKRKLEKHFKTKIQKGYIEKKREEFNSQFNSNMNTSEIMNYMIFHNTMDFLDSDKKSYSEIRHSTKTDNSSHINHNENHHSSYNSGSSYDSSSSSSSD